MQNILVAIFSIGTEYKQVLNVFEEKEWDVHLFEADHLKEEIDLETILEYVHNYYETEVNIYFVSDIEEYVEYIQRQLYKYVSGVIWYVLNKNKSLNCIEGDKIYLMSSSDENIIFQMIKQPFCYYKFDINKCIYSDLYLTYYYQQSVKKYQCNANLMLSILALDFMWTQTHSYEKVNEILQEIINEPSEDIIEYVLEYLPYFSVQLQSSYLMALYEKTKEISYIHRCLEIAPQLDIKESHGLMWSITRQNFVGKIPFTSLEEKKFMEFYSKRLEQIKLGDFSTQNKPQNEHRIVILTHQFLGIQHAPTRNVLDYADTLIDMGYEVWIMNTSEMMKKNYFPVLDFMQGNYIDKYDEISAITYKGKTIPFFQNKYDMPNPTVIKMILGLIEQYNPKFVINIGDMHMTADLCAKYFKTIHIPCGSRVPKQKYGCLAIPAKPNLKQLENIENKYLNIKYSFLEKTKSNEYTRKALGIPKEAFILTIVGNRLDSEVTEEFLSLLLKIIKTYPCVYFVFMGVYATYNTMIKKYSKLQEHSKFMENVQDIMAVYDVCDAYLNPKRKGGATSAAEAMMAGLPVITPTYGDVYYQLWLDEGYDTNEEVIEIIGKMISDPSFYKKLSNSAKENIQESFDTRKMMSKIIKFMDEIE